MNQRDYLNATGAEVLMRRIWLFWREQGYSVECWIDLDYGVYCVRSNLVNGMPRKPRFA